MKICRFMLFTSLLLLMGCSGNKVEFSTIDIFPTSITVATGRNASGQNFGGPVCSSGTCTCFSSQYGQVGFSRHKDPGSGPLNCTDNCDCVFRTIVEFDIENNINLNAVGANIFSAELHWKSDLPETRTIPSSVYPPNKSCVSGLYVINSVITDFPTSTPDPDLRVLYPISKFTEPWGTGDISEQPFATVTDYVKGLKPAGNFPTLRFVLTGPDESIRSANEHDCFSALEKGGLFLRVILTTTTGKWPSS